MKYPKVPTSNFWSTSLSASIDDSATTITLATTSGLQAPGRLIIDREDGNGNATPNSREIVYFTGVSGNDITGVTRGADGSTARSHNAGALVEAVPTVGDFSDARTVFTTQHDETGIHTNITATSIAVSGNATVSGIVNVPQLALSSIASIANVHTTDIIGANASITTIHSSDIFSADATITSVANIKNIALTSVASVAIPEFHIGNSEGDIIIHPGVGKAVKIDTINERTPANGVTVDGVLLKDSQVTTDTINEQTAGAGVTVDGCLIKDGEAAKAALLAPHLVRVTHSAAQDVDDTTVTILSWDTDIYDTDNFHDTSTNNNRITIPTGLDGYYLVGAVVRYSGNTDGARDIRIEKNGTRVWLGQTTYPSTTTGAEVSTSVVLYLAAGDYIEVAVWQNSGSTLKIESGTTGDLSGFWAIRLSG